jgi:hypothetical protein
MTDNKRTPDAISRARELSLAGLLGALGLLLPIGFHALGWGGKVFLPMHVPVVVAAFVVGPATAASVGLIVPLLSAILTGMPPLAPPLAPLMALELSAKAGTASVLYRKLHCPLWVALPVAIVVDWGVLALAAAVAAGFFAIRLPPLQYLWGVIGLSLPGTVLQLVAVPLAIAAIERRVPRLRRSEVRKQR